MTWEPGAAEPCADTIAAARRGGAADRALDAAPIIGGGRSGGGPTVLAVEATPSELQRLVTALSALGCRVVPVEDGHTAVDWAEIFRPQAIILSTRLPDFDGREVLFWLRQSERVGRACIVLVAEVDEALGVEDCARATAVLRRPLRLEQLTAILVRQGLVAAPAS